MKKLLLSTALLSIASPALANDYNSLSPLSGFYVGGFAGYTDVDVDGPGGTDFDLDGKDYGLFAGYQADALLDKTINRMGLGLNGAIEFDYAWSNADKNIGAANVEKDSEWGINFRPGLSFLSETTPLGLNPYGIVGYRRASFDGSSGGFSADEHFDGFELGVGTELVAYGDYGVRLDYSHVWYEENNGFDPSENNIRAGLAYHF